MEESVNVRATRPRRRRSGSSVRQTSAMRPQVVAHRGASFDNRRAHVGRLRAGDPRRRRGPRVRRPAHRRRPPGLRPRPRPASYGQHQAAWSRRWSWPTSTSSSSPPGRTRGPRSTTRQADRDPDLDRVLTLRRLMETVAEADTPDRARDRDQAPDAVRRAGRAPPGGGARGVRLDRPGQPGAGDELLLRRAAAHAAAGAATCAW